MSYECLGSKRGFVCIIRPILFEWNSWTTVTAKMFSFRVFYNKFIAERGRVFWNFGNLLLSLFTHHNRWNLALLRAPESNFTEYFKHYHIKVLLINLNGLATELKSRNWDLLQQSKMYNSISWTFVSGTKRISVGYIFVFAASFRFGGIAIYQ